jgi:hypothetical protein
LQEYNEAAAAGRNVNGTEETQELLRLIVKGWENIYDGDEPLEFTPENLRRITTELEWFGVQIVQFAGDHANFFSEN